MGTLRRALLQAYYTTLKIVWNSYRLPDTVHERNKIQRFRVVSDKDLRPLLSDTIPLIVIPDYPVHNRANISDPIVGGTVIKMGDNDTDFLGYGWYPLEATVEDPEIIYRWTREEAVAYLHPSASTGAICLDVLALPETIGKTVKVTLYLDSLELGEIELSRDGWHHLSFDVKADNNWLVELKIENRTMWVPAKILMNRDRRTLGVGVRRIEWKSHT